MMQSSSEQRVFSREEYAKKNFWEERYAGKKLYFDWYVEYPELKESLESAYGIQKSAKILMLGCGNSKLSEQMYDAGYHNIVNIDISESVIEQMSTATSSKGKKMEWLVMDGCDLKFPDASFDVVLDKGTLDAVICGKDLTISNKMLQEAKRVIKPTGKIIVITHGPPEGRKRVFETPLPFHEFDYYFTKLGLSDSSMLINLMRSNLKDKPLKGIIENKEALQRSILEYKLLQMVKRMKKTMKYKIYWVKTEEKEVTGIEEESKVEPEISGKQTQQVPVPVPQTISATAEQQPAKPLYNPRKQSFCFVYCIHLKPHKVIQYLQKLYSSLEDSPVVEQIKAMEIDKIVHEPKFQTFEVNPEIEECVIFTTTAPYSLLLAIKHLQTQGIKFPRVIVNYNGQPDKADSLQEDPTPEKSVIARMNYIFTDEGFDASVLTCVKANLKISATQHTRNDLGFGRETFNFIHELQNYIERLDIGLNQPNPHIYSTLLQVAEGSHQPIQELLRRFWHPELIVTELTSSQPSVVNIEAIITLPPNSPTQKIFELLQKEFSQYKLALRSADPGFLAENPQWLSKALVQFSSSYLDEETEWAPVCDFRQYFGIINIPSRDPRQQFLFLSKPHASSALAEVLSRSVSV